MTARRIRLVGIRLELEVDVELGRRRIGRPAYLYACLLGFSFFFIGVFVLRRQPRLRAAQIFFLLCILFLLFLVCRLRPASYSWVDRIVLGSDYCFEVGYERPLAHVDALGLNIVGDAANEPSIAMDPLNPDMMVIGWRQFDTISSNFRQAGYGYTTDGGLT